MDNYERVYDVPLHPRRKRYCDRAEVHIRRMIREEDFDSAFTAGEKMSLDEALDLALKTVEET